jgi:hypothetical protein
MISMYASTVSMRVFMPSFSRCLSSPMRESSHGMSSGRTTFLRFALRAGALSAWSSSAWYSSWFMVPLFQAFDSLHAIVISWGLTPLLRAARHVPGCGLRPRFSLSVIEVRFVFARREALGARNGSLGRGSTWCWKSMFMNMYMGFVLMTRARAGLVGSR